MAFTKMSTQPRMLTEKLVRASAFKQLKSFGNAHCRWQVNKDMNMIRLNLKLMDFNVVVLRNLAQKLFAVVANNGKLKGVFRVFRLPYKMEAVLSDAVLMVCKAFHFSFLRAFFCGANATQDGYLSVPATPRTHLYSKELEKDYGGTGCPWAKAQGIL